jgi:hypothetical protein
MIPNGFPGEPEQDSGMMVQDSGMMVNADCTKPLRGNPIDPSRLTMPEPSS